MTTDIPNDILKLQKLKANVTVRARLIKAIREFFWSQDFIETETPVVVDAPAPEEYIEAPVTDKGFLRTSPELQMKRLVTAGYEKIFQLGPCFREGEIGRLHREEFTMLEWYETGIDYTALYHFTGALLNHLAGELTTTGKLTFRQHTIDMSAPPEIITVHDAFATFANCNVEDTLANDTFEEVLVDQVEPRLGLERPTILIDYPAKLAALSRRKASAPQLSERWELYIGGIELANAYSELTDANEQRERFATFAQTRQATGYRSYPEATNFLHALDYGMPECAGCALGIDRLVMIFTDAGTIEEVLLPQ